MNHASGPGQFAVVAVTRLFSLPANDHFQRLRFIYFARLACVASVDLTPNVKLGFTGVFFVLASLFFFLLAGKVLRTFHLFDL